MILWDAFAVVSYALKNSKFKDQLIAFEIACVIFFLEMLSVILFYFKLQKVKKSYFDRR